MKKGCKRHGSVYVARNTVTGDCYVGQTIKPLSYRVSAHKASSKKPKTKFGLALAEFGFAQFIFSEVFIAFDRDALNKAEKHFINDLRPVYNSTIGGAGVPGRVVSATTKEKLREATRARWSDPEYRNKVTRAIQESCSTDEYANRCREIGLRHGGQRWANYVKKPKLVKDRSASMKAAWANPVVRQRIASAVRSANLAPAHRARLSAAGMGRSHSKAVIEKIAAQKHKPVLCPELQVTFLSRKHAAEWIGACRSAITTAIQRKGKVFKLYTFCEVSQIQYQTLFTTIKGYLENDFPNTTFTGSTGAAVSLTSAEQINTFITQAEQRIYNTVLFPALRKNVTGSTSANNKYLNCPNDFLAVYSMAVVNGTGAYSYLLNKDVSFIREAYPTPTDTGLPAYYALFGPVSTDETELTFILGPTPDDLYTLELHYFYYPESITTAASGYTWLSENFDPVLLYGSLVEAYTFMKGEPDMIANYEKKYQESLMLAKRLGDGMEKQDQYRSGTPRVPVN